MNTMTQRNNREWEKRVKKDIQNEFPNVFVQDAEDEIIKLIRDEKALTVKETREEVIGSLLQMQGWAEKFQKNNVDVDIEWLLYKLDNSLTYLKNKS